MPETHEDAASAPFHESAMRRQFLYDAAVRWTAAAAMLALVAYVMATGPGGALISGLTVFIVAGAWIGMGLISARTLRDLPTITAAIQTDPAAAEAGLGDALRRVPLAAWARVMLYHRLAVLRHRQQRFAEAGRVCAALLGRPMGAARNLRPHLLLMLAEAALESGDVVTAYHALLDLHHTRLSLSEALQRMALQTRYEVAIGRYDAAARDAASKVSLAELLPAAQCGAVHAMLAAAAQHTAQDDLARRLWARVELLCTPQQVDRLKAGGFGVGLVQTTEELTEL